jgi:uncharacterized membrane protein YphA (DoxX/SURF4 family)
LSTAAFVASIVVGAALVLAGVSKLAAGDTWPSQARGLGAPDRLIPLLPWLEIVVGALLIAQVARPAMATIAIALLLAFTALLVVNLRQGRRPPCACFGAWSAKPIGAGHIARNLALIALAVIAAL